MKKLSGGRFQQRFIKTFDVPGYQLGLHKLIFGLNLSPTALKVGVIHLSILLKKLVNSK